MDLNDQKHETARLIAIELIKKLDPTVVGQPLDDALNKVTCISVEMANTIHNEVCRRVKLKNVSYRSVEDYFDY